MVCSMTGFGRGEAVEGSRRITVEMKSVNNRFLDLSMKMPLPRMLNPYEAKIRTEVGRFIRRGKVDLFISYVNLEDPGEEVCYHPSLAAEYLQHLGEMKEAFGLSGEVSLSLLAGLPDVRAMTRICGRFWHRPSTRLAMRFLRRGRRRGNFCGTIFSASSMP